MEQDRAPTALCADNTQQDDAIDRSFLGHPWTDSHSYYWLLSASSRHHFLRYPQQCTVLKRSSCHDQRVPMTDPPLAEVSVSLLETRRRLTQPIHEILCFQPSSAYWPWVTLRTDLDDEVSGQVCGLQVPSRTLNQCQHYWQEICQGSFSSLHREDFPAYPRQTPGFLWWHWQLVRARSTVSTWHWSDPASLWISFLNIFLCEICIRRASIAVRLWKGVECRRHKETK